MQRDPTSATAQLAGGSTVQTWRMYEELPRPTVSGSQQSDVPGRDAPLNPPADYGETSYKGSARLQGKVALITGADSGIGRAVAIAYAR